MIIFENAKRCEISVLGWRRKCAERWQAFCCGRGDGVLNSIDVDRDVAHEVLRCLSEPVAKEPACNEVDRGFVRSTFGFRAIFGNNVANVFATVLQAIQELCVACEQAPLLRFDLFKISCSCGRQFPHCYRGWVCKRIQTFGA